MFCSVGRDDDKGFQRNCKSSTIKNLISVACNLAGLILLQYTIMIPLLVEYIYSILSDTVSNRTFDLWCIDILLQSGARINISNSSSSERLVIVLFMHTLA